ncbi:phage portal protein [Kitasatospora sp. NPDC004289]
MPLPDRDQHWPPTDPVILNSYADWAAWYSSNPDLIADRYTNRAVKGAVNRPSQYRGGIVGRFSRWFWGQPTAAGERRAKLHIPLAADIARTSSDLLFSEPPKLTATATATQQALDDLMDGSLFPTLVEGGERSAAMGNKYYRVVWNQAVRPTPWISVVGGDCAIPEFTFGVLTAATFWQVVAVEGQTVWRHLERHESGVILHGLYEGTEDHLGMPQPLTAQPATKDLAREVATGTKLLTAAHVPNCRPARGWPGIPQAEYLGQSDYQGIEGIFDQLDETWSSWMRDIRLGKGRILLDQQYLTSNGPGRGVSADLDREVYAELNIPPTAGAGITLSQFAIRVAEHERTAQALTEQAVRQAGYSAATFGQVSDGQAVTATEIKARQGRSMSTRARKALYEQYGLAQITAAWLGVMAGDQFKVAGLSLEPPTVTFEDSVQEDPKVVAETLSLLEQARAASTQVKVQMLHPDWDDTAVKEETDRITAEQGLGPEADPVLLGAGGAGLT